MIKSKNDLLIWGQEDVNSRLTNKTKKTVNTTLKHGDSGIMTGTIDNGKKQLKNSTWEVLSDGKIIEDNKHEYYIGEDTEGNLYKLNEKFEILTYIIITD